MSQRSVALSEDNPHHTHQPTPALRDRLAASGIGVASECDGAGTCGRCRVRASSPEPLTPAERRALSVEDLAAGFRLSCQVHAAELTDVAVPALDDAWHGLALPREPRARRPVTGLAIDVGTTHLRVSLWHEGRRVGARIGRNPQGHYGADVLTRLARAAHHPDEAETLRRLVLDAIAAAATTLAREHGVAIGDVSRAVVVGNTAMLALLTGRGAAALLDPARWMAPIDCTADVRPLRARWEWPAAVAIDAVPPVAGFVGSDLLAAALATRVCDDAPGTLLVDFGTNTEVAFWDGQTLHATSAAGGPAFEGCGISCGTSASPGAIVRVAPDPASPTALRCDVLGDDQPRGLSGSGLIDAIACFVANGAISRSGRLATAVQRLPIWQGRAEIALLKRDIDVFQRAKAAIAAAIELLRTHAGADRGAIPRLCVCGAFGEYLDLDHAHAIGLLPPVAADRFELHAHAALLGAEQALTSEAAAAELDAIRARTRVLNLAADRRYEDCFITHLALRPFTSRESQAC